MTCSQKSDSTHTCHWWLKGKVAKCNTQSMGRRKEVAHIVCTVADVLTVRTKCTIIVSYIP